MFCKLLNRRDLFSLVVLAKKPAETYGKPSFTFQKAKRFDSNLRAKEGLQALACTKMHEFRKKSKLDLKGKGIIFDREEIIWTFDC